ncbi:MAG TPA: hypothetical protein VFD92_13560 [Candidatus Binatia bacterium]|nr:hypothetical protein [Candidatus Binatia bacterium]
MGRRSLAVVAIAAVAALALAAGVGRAAALSTSIMNPTPVGESGVVEASFPEGKTAYYVAADVKAGSLLTQMSFDGRPGAQKSVDVTLLDASGRQSAGAWVHGEEPAEEKTRIFPIDASGRQVVRIEVEGPPTARFRVEFGGDALAAAAPKPAPPAGQLSRSIFTPTPVGPDGVVSGPLPGADKRATYYVAVDAKKGDLLSQISLSGREGAAKSLDFSLLADDAAAGQTYWVHGEGAAEEKTRSFPIDRDGRRIVKLVVEGPETARFKVELGGSALVPPTAASGAATTAQAQAPAL